jgi:hypothetical protein
VRSRHPVIHGYLWVAVLLPLAVTAVILLAVVRASDRGGIIVGAALVTTVLQTVAIVVFVRRRYAGATTAAEAAVVRSELDRDLSKFAKWVGLVGAALPLAFLVLGLVLVLKS